MFDHPLVDYVDRRCACVESRADIVYFSEALSDLLNTVGEHRLTPVVITKPEALLTFAARYYLEAAGGVWLIRTDDGMIDRRTGTLYQEAGDLTDPAIPGAALAPAVAPAPGALQLFFSLSVQHTARDETRLGDGAEALARAVGSKLAGWGAHEPAVLRWSRRAYTDAARRAMPDESRFVVASESGDFQAVALVRRTSGGVEETLSGVALAGDAGTTLPQLGERVAAALTAIAESTALPLLAMVSVGPGRRDLTSDQHPVPVPVPMAALLGPRAIRNLRADPETLARQFRVSTVGRKRIPSVLVNFIDSETAPWLEAQRFAEALGVSNIEAALRATDPSPSVGGDR